MADLPTVPGGVAPTRLFVGNLPRGTTHQDIFNIFTTLPLQGIESPSAIELMDGSCFVEYGDASDARLAVIWAHDREFKGKKLIVEDARRRRGENDFAIPHADHLQQGGQPQNGRPQEAQYREHKWESWEDRRHSMGSRRSMEAQRERMRTADEGGVSPTRFYLGNLPRETTKRDIEKHFAGTGAIKEIKLLQGFGFMEYKFASDARRVPALYHGSYLMGERLTVQFAREPRVKQPIQQEITEASSEEEDTSQSPSEVPAKSIVAHYTISRDLCGSQDSVTASMLSALAERSDDRSTILSRLAR